MNKYEPVLKIAKWIWVVAVIVLGANYLISRWAQVENYFFSIPAGKFALAIVFLMFGKLSLVFLTKFSIEREDVALTYFDVFSIVSFTQLAKYLPGGVWHFISRFGAYNRQKLSVKRSTRAMIIENAWLLTGALMVGVLTGILSGQGRQFFEMSGIHMQWAVLGLVTLLLWLMLLIGFERLFRAEKRIPYIKVFSMQVISWLCLGISFICVLPSYVFAEALFQISVFSFSWLAGYVVIFAPGGIGVRELVIVWMLSGVMKSDDVVVFSTVHRFFFIVAELILGAVAGLVDVFQKKK